MSIALLAACLSSQLVPYNGYGWEVKQNLIIDTTQTCNPWVGPEHALTTAQLVKESDRLCAIWGRTTMSATACKAELSSAQNLADGAAADFKSGVSFVEYPALSEIGSTNGCVDYGLPWQPVYYPFFCDEVDMMWFCSNNSGDVDWATCETASGYPPLRPCTASAECHPTQTCNAGQCSAPCTSGTLTFQSPGASGNSNGDAGDRSLHGTGLHEWGHRMGLDHPIASSVCGFQSCSPTNPCVNTATTCVANLCRPPPTQVCPVMAGSGAREAFWPNSQDTQTVRQPAQLEIRFANISTDGILSSPYAGCTLPSVTWAPPQVSCRPNTNSTRPCVVSWRESSSAGPTFTFLDLPTSGACSGEISLTSTWRSDGPVDVAYGTSRIVGAGSRPPGVTTRPNEIVLYSMVNNQYTETIFPRAEWALQNTFTNSQSISSHTEVSISYHEPVDRFVVAYVDLNSSVRLLSLRGSDGRPVDSAGAPLLPVDTTFDSILPPRIVCDAHAPGASNVCFLYLVPTSGGVANIFNGAFIRASVSFDATGALTVGNNFAVESSAQVALLLGGGTFGENSASSQMPGGYFLNADAFSSNSNFAEVRLMVDDIGRFSSSVDVFTSTYFTLTNQAGLFFETNLSSFDWNENLRRFVIATAK